MTLDTSGIDSILANLLPRLDDIVGDTALNIELDAKLVAPRDPARPPKDPSVPVTGALRSSLEAERIEPGHWWVHDGVEYGVFQELGTSRGVPARPFLVPAVEQHRETFYQRMAEVYRP